MLLFFQRFQYDLRFLLGGKMSSFSHRNSILHLIFALFFV
jgi:hypothetical protein